MDPMTQNPQQAPVAQPMMPDTSPINTTPSMPKSTPAKKTSFGPLIGAAIIIALLIAGALYFWSPLLMPDSEQSTALYKTSMNSNGLAVDSQVASATAAIDALQGGIDQDMNALNQSMSK